MKILFRYLPALVTVLIVSSVACAASLPPAAQIAAYDKEIQELEVTPQAQDIRRLLDISYDLGKIEDRLHEKNPKNPLLMKTKHLQLKILNLHQYLEREARRSRHQYGSFSAASVARAEYATELRGIQSELIHILTVKEDYELSVLRDVGELAAGLNKLGIPKTDNELVYVELEGHQVVRAEVNATDHTARLLFSQAPKAVCVGLLQAAVKDVREFGYLVDYPPSTFRVGESKMTARLSCVPSAYTPSSYMPSIILEAHESSTAQKKPADSHQSSILSTSDYSGIENTVRNLIPVEDDGV